MKDYVLSRALSPLIEVAERHGMDEDEMVRGLSFRHADIRRGYWHLPWNEFACYLNRLDEALGDDFIAEAIKAFHKDDSFAIFRRVGGLFCSPARYYWMVNNYFTPMMFPVLESEVEQLSPRRQRITTGVPEELDECLGYFRLSAEVLRVGPTVLGMKPARVTADCRPRGATFDVEFPPSLSLFARGRRMLDNALSSRRFMEEFVEQGESLEQSYSVLQSTEEGFRRLVERSPEGIVIFDREEVVFANDAAAELLGWEQAADLLGHPLDSLREGATEEEYDLYSAVEVDHPVPVSIRGRHGRPIALEAGSIESVFMGREVWISQLRDVAFRNDVMSRALEMDRLITMGTLAAGISHEISNPITYVQTNLEFIFEELQGVLSGEVNELDRETREEILEALNVCREGTQRAAAVTRDLKSVGRDGSDAIEPVDLRDAVEGALRWTRSDIIQRAQLIVDLKRVGLVTTNLPRIQQIVLNLILNAIKAIEPGHRMDNEIRLSTYRRDDKAIIEVSDTGRGISAAQMDRVFEPFYTTRARGEGTGLGLFISKNIVDRLGGTLTLESLEGEGTTARIALPFEREE